MVFVEDASGIFRATGGTPTHQPNRKVFVVNVLYVLGYLVEHLSKGFLEQEKNRLS